MVGGGWGGRVVGGFLVITVSHPTLSCVVVERMCIIFSN